MTSKSIGNFKVVIENGKEKLVEKPKRYDVSTELKRRNSRKIRVVKKGQS